MKHNFQKNSFIPEFIGDLMACELFHNERRNMAISVTVLGMTLCVVFLAYFAFSESHNEPDLSTVRFAAIVSLRFFNFFSSSSNERTDLQYFFLNFLCNLAKVFRHGERAPTGTYPNDPHMNYTWTGGLGALVPVFCNDCYFYSKNKMVNNFFCLQRGSLQLYNLGKSLRKRYNQLIPSTGIYSSDFMNVQSSATERCSMSAQSLMAGFLPPVGESHSLPIPWQPIAITSVARSQDRVGYPSLFVVFFFILIYIN